RRATPLANPSISSAPSAPPPNHIALFGDGAALIVGCGGVAFLNPISQRSRLITPASWSLPRGANALFVAAITWFAAPSGGPPHWPRCGFAHLIGPVHQWRI